MSSLLFADLFKIIFSEISVRPNLGPKLHQQTTKFAPGRKKVILEFHICVNTVHLHKQLFHLLMKIFKVHLSQKSNHTLLKITDVYYLD